MPVPTSMNIQTVGGTLDAIAGGTLAAVTSVINLVSGTLLNSGTTTGVGVVTSVTNIVAGTITALATGTITAGTVVHSYPSFKFISAAGTTTVKTGVGIVHSLSIGSLLGGGTLYNSAGTSASVIWAATTPPVTHYVFDLAFGSLTWAGTGAQAITIVYS